MKNVLIVLSMAFVCGGCLSSAKPEPPCSAQSTYARLEAERAAKGGYHVPEMATPRAAVWQAQNRAALDAATASEVLAQFVASPEAADALCAAVVPGYATDPLKAVQIGAVSVYVMGPGRDAQRKLWVAALARARRRAPTCDVETFFAQQLMVAGYEPMKTLR